MAEDTTLRSGDVGAFREVSQNAEPNASPDAARHALPPEPPWVVYDPELERLCRIAASVGGDAQAAPLSYTALVIAFLFGEDKVSTWFQSYVETSNIALDEIFRSKNTTVRARSAHVARADSGALPVTNPLYSRSVRNIMEQAARIARDVAQVQFAVPTLGPRHVMAAFAFRNPSDHQDQVRGWGFLDTAWQEQFLGFAQQAFPDEQWLRLKGFAPAYVEAVSSFTSDDPLSAARDLLGVEDEAAAFARIAAATSIKPPLAVGVFGEWGSGKTFFMRRIYEHVQALTKRAVARPGHPLFHTDIVQIRFNAWHYIETNLWASLVEYIFAELDRWLRDKTRDGRSEADLVFDRLATAQQLKLDALEGVVSRRAERRSAELRAERARREYEEALARASAVGADTYARALLDTLLAQGGLREDLAGIGTALGTPALAKSAGQVMEVLEQARSEAGRARLIMRAGIGKLGTWRWILSLVLVLVGFPLLTVGLKDLVALVTNSEGIKAIHDSVLAIASLAAAAAACGGTLVRRASKILQQVDAFDRTLRQKVAEQTQQLQGSDVAAQKSSAEEDLRKRRQAMEAAERALADADARLAAARQDFESATARSRLNAFIRAKATEGDYAKHLGIIAAIRRDFSQLASLMGATNDSGEQRAESERLAAEAEARVTLFLDWLKGKPDVRLTPGELRSLLSLLEPPAALRVLESKHATVTQHLEGTDEDLKALQVELTGIASKELPRFSRIILYIDDLDRCPPDTVVKVLQAVHLLLTFPLFIVVVAVDARWVSRALREQFPKLLSETGMFASNGDTTAGAGAGATSHDYLEKIFQIPYWVRPIDPKGASSYVNSLVEPDVRRVAAAVDASVSTPATPLDDGSDPRPAPGSSPLRGARAPAPAPPPQHQDAEREAIGLELTRWEADALERFAPLVGATPRRLVRFVNVYRLIKTSLPPAMLERFVGERGESDAYRALIAQLAIVTAAPESAQRYFSVLETGSADESLETVMTKLGADPAFSKGVDRETVHRILTVARDSPGAALSVGHMLVTAPIARRYSFTARPH